MIVGHVTKTPFPYWDNMWVWIALGAIDGHAPFLFGRFVVHILSIMATCVNGWLHWVLRESLIQSTATRQIAFVYLSLGLSLLSYGRFCTYVIKDITEYLGIACFTVRYVVVLAESRNLANKFTKQQQKE